MIVQTDCYTNQTNKSIQLHLNVGDKKKGNVSNSNNAANPKREMKSILLIAILIASVSQFASAQQPVLVQTYVMSKCPDAANFFLDFQKSVLSFDGLSSIMNVTMDFIATVNASKKTGFDCMHGQSECTGDITELCAQFASGFDWQTWITMVVCADGNYNGIPQILASCAQLANISNDKINACVNSAAGDALMNASIQRTAELNFKAVWSPTVFINGQCVSGAPPCLNLSGAALREAICNSYSGIPPAGCSQVNQISKVNFS